MKSWKRIQILSIHGPQMLNVPDQTEEEKAESHENAPVEDLAENEEIKRRKQT